ncbi:MAG: zinc-finger domain-containing protein [Candidatus Accumulibacter sp.]|nr:zinc-finger domain-containing protein [Accumulibacter sp.]
MTDPHTVEVTELDLPLRCPPASGTAWNQHPRVFLEVRRTGEASCPCGRAHYVFKSQAAKGC